MENSWTLHIFGTRGSLPVVSGEFSEYGGNTSCMAVETPKTAVIFDGGSGLANFRGIDGKLRKKGVKRIDLFISHFHIDHLIGLFHFAPLADPKWEVHLYGAAAEGVSLEGRLAQLLGPPFWPVRLLEEKKNLILHTIAPEEKTELPGGITVTAFEGCHPGGVLLFAMEGNGKKLVYGLDCEINMEAEEQEGGWLGRLLCAADEADLLIFDAAYSPEELASHRGWGHSDWKTGLWVKNKASAGMILMTHYGPDYTDRKLKKQERSAQKKDGACIFAREGMEIVL